MIISNKPFHFFMKFWMLQEKKLCLCGIFAKRQFPIFWVFFFLHLESSTYQKLSGIKVDNKVNFSKRWIKQLERQFVKLANVRVFNSWTFQIINSRVLAQQTFVLMKTSFAFVFRRCLQDVCKTSSSRRI